MIEDTGRHIEMVEELLLERYEKLKDWYDRIKEIQNCLNPYSDEIPKTLRKVINLEADLFKAVEEAKQEYEGF